MTYVDLGQRAAARPCERVYAADGRTNDDPCPGITGFVCSPADMRAWFDALDAMMTRIPGHMTAITSAGMLEKATILQTRGQTLLDGRTWGQYSAGDMPSILAVLAGIQCLIIDARARAKELYPQQQLPKYTPLAPDIETGEPAPVPNWALPWVVGGAVVLALWAGHKLRRTQS